MQPAVSLQVYKSHPCSLCRRHGEDENLYISHMIALTFVHHMFNFFKMFLFVAVCFCSFNVGDCLCDIEVHNWLLPCVFRVQSL